MIRFDKDDRHIIYVWGGYEEQTIVNVHDAELCKGRECTVHNPTEHPLRNYPLRWRTMQGLFYRVLPDDSEVLDPDQFTYLRETGRFHHVKAVPNGYIYDTSGPKVQCGNCGDVVQSQHRHHMDICECGQTGVDGGADYMRGFGPGQEVTQ